MRILLLLFLVPVLLLSLACAGESAATDPAATPDLEATVQAAVSAALPTETPTPQPDIEATVAAGIAATRAAEPTLTPTPQPTPDIDATVEARMAATIAAMPTATPTLVPTATPAPTASPTPVPTATPTPVPTATRRPTSTPVPTSTPQTALSASVVLSEMVKRVRPGVVRIESRVSNGSGAIFETQGRTAYIVTNHHVVEGSAEVSVTVNDSAEYQGTVLGTDAVRDLAVVRICCGSFRILPFGDASTLEPGDEVVAIGYALGLLGEATITRGIVSAIRYDANYLSDVIQTDAAINPGNSGGPMLSPAGQMLGINTFRYDRTEGGRTAEGLGFAISAKTVQARIPSLKTARAAPTPAPTRGPTPTSSYDRGFGPTSGELWHDPTNGLIETEYAGVNLSDASVNATFFNPYSAGSHSWDYGFILREDRFDDTVPFIQVVVSSNGRWSVLVGAKPPYNQIAGGTVKNFSALAGGQNTLHFTAKGDIGTLWVNGEVIEGIDISARTAPGDFAVITGAFLGNEVTGSTTRFEYFNVTPWNRLYGPTSGTLERVQERISNHDSGVWIRDFIAEARFANPTGTDWDYGFGFRNSSNRVEVIIVTGTGSWFHYTRGIEDEEFTEVASGRLADSGVILNTQNLLSVNGNSVVGSFSVNGVKVTSLDLSHNLDAGKIDLIANFFSGHNSSPAFKDFNVWTWEQ